MLHGVFVAIKNVFRFVTVLRKRTTHGQDIPSRSGSALHVMGKPVPSYNRDIRRYEVVQLPKATYGECRVKSCSVVGDLADGLCVRHWDMGKSCVVE